MIIRKIDSTKQTRKLINRPTLENEEKEKKAKIDLRPLDGRIHTK